MVVRPCFPPTWWLLLVLMLGGELNTEYGNGTGRARMTCELHPWACAHNDLRTGPPSDHCTTRDNVPSSPVSLYLSQSNSSSRGLASTVCVHSAFVLSRRSLNCDQKEAQKSLHVHTHVELLMMMLCCLSGFPVTWMIIELGLFTTQTCTHHHQTQPFSNSTSVLCAQTGCIDLQLVVCPSPHPLDHARLLQTELNPDVFICVDRTLFSVGAFSSRRVQTSQLRPSEQPRWAFGSTRRLWSWVPSRLSFSKRYVKITRVLFKPGLFDILTAREVLNRR